MRRFIFTRSSALLLVVGVVLTRSIAADTDSSGHLARVRAYAEALLQHGRDTYGPRSSPLIVTCMLLPTFEHLGRENPHTVMLNAAGYRPKDAVFRAANPQLDQNFYQILYALTTITGERRYAQEADTILTAFFRVGQSPRTGLLAWGEHLGIGFDDEQVENALWLRGGRWAARFQDRPIHEFFRPWVLWPETFRLARGTAVRFARGLWDHQIHEHSGDFSRHAGFDALNPDPSTGSHFPRHGGFYIRTWAHALRETSDPVFEQAITTQLDFYDRIRDPEDGFVPMTDSGRNLSREKGYEARSNLSLAIDLHASSRLVASPLSARLQSFADRELTLYLQLTPEDIGPAGWKSGYGDISAAGTGVMLFEASAATADPALGEKLQRRARALAVAYLDGNPAEARFLTPGNLGQAIWLMLDAAAVTGDARYRAKAEFYARYASDQLLNGVPVPRAMRGANFYHAITRGDTLMLALLRLSQVGQASARAVPLIYSDR